MHTSSRRAVRNARAVSAVLATLLVGIPQHRPTRRLFARSNGISTP